ncbi:hypothetical protein PsorP6_001695 [Peronosclerospora sorghi]|uniref:Uncharacterized protein n=1 Tax=Peronosclerospora sorghi TaxID=230839 RepID=A0ACC0WQA9_9STRA|nr:hypothetical protein PsorP6_001695 [Peronosclerospora sorghi]
MRNLEVEVTCTRSGTPMITNFDHTLILLLDVNFSDIDCIRSTFLSKGAEDTQSLPRNMPSIVCPMIRDVSPSSEAP